MNTKRNKYDKRDSLEIGEKAEALFGQADFIAVEKINVFVLVKRVDLLALVEQIVDLSFVVSSARQAKYRVYSRRNRPDKISLIETKKLESIKWDEWGKVL